MKKLVVMMALVVALTASIKVAVPTDAFDGEADKGFSVEIERPDAIVIEPPVEEEPEIEIEEPVIEEPEVEIEIVEPVVEPVVEPIPEEPATEEEEIDVPEELEEVTETTSVPAPSKKEEPEEEEVVHETVVVYDEPVYAPVEPAVEGEVLSSVVEVPETGDLLWVYIGAAALGFLVIANVIRKMVA